MAGPWSPTSVLNWFSKPSRWPYTCDGHRVSSTTPIRGYNTAYAFGKRCSEWGVRPSMGSVGDCYDNALCESFFASLECELLDRRSFQTHAEARMAVFQYIEGWYNTHRRHSSIGYYAPIAFERRYTSSIQHVEPLTIHQIGSTPTCGFERRTLPRCTGRYGTMRSNCASVISMPYFYHIYTR